MEHSRFGGVVPELASRTHLNKIDHLTETVLKECAIFPSSIDLLAVTDSPGLAGALLVGVSFALGLHTAWNIPITGINHLEGHICSVLIENSDIKMPFLALVVSGGHTALYRIDSFGRYQCLGETVDDAAGEAFDKVGKLLGFTYPAGRHIEQEAASFSGDDSLIPTFPVARCSQGELHFSFSGLKTAVKYFLSDKSQENIQQMRSAICYGFQKSITNALVGNAVRASEITGISSIALVGGVACNTFLREELRRRFPGTVYVPPNNLCTDNAAMIAMAGYLRHGSGLLRIPKMNPSSSL
jgi:N6-L-threonylcarbamoyladenine synthase